MNINKKKLGIIGAISIISVILISVFIFTQIGPYDKNNKKGIVVEIPQGATTSTISDILYKNKSYTSRHVFSRVHCIGSTLKLQSTYFYPPRVTSCLSYQFRAS